ncbi:hypothetical protein MFLAVUS_007296 [Mucor flavus]|uniref:Uncharacterized protein n=1 Tax=Mucor flavus TaxID=439312 RepID=A0ABP9Z3Y2_9FUNG
MEFLSGDETYNADEEATNEYKTYCLEQDKFASFDYFPDAADFIEAVLKADKDKFPETLRSHDIRLNATGFTRKLVGIICYTLTDFNSNCNQVFSSNNHERISFVKYIVPMFKYFGQETNLIEFRCLEILLN